MQFFKEEKKELLLEIKNGLIIEYKNEIHYRTTRISAIAQIIYLVNDNKIIARLMCHQYSEEVYEFDTKEEADVFHAAITTVFHALHHEGK